MSDLPTELSFSIKEAMPAAPISGEPKPPCVAADPELLRDLRTGEISPRFLYQTKEQAEMWVALQRAFSPWQVDADCAEVYRKTFAGVAGGLKGRDVHLVGLGCGDGTKDAEFLRAASKIGLRCCCTALDVGSEMALGGMREAASVVSEGRCGSAVCDLLRDQNIGEVLASAESRFFGGTTPLPFTRVCTLFGMLPVFQPEQLMSALKQAVRASDLLLLSANLVPGPDYDAGLLRVVPQYDNGQTREWLLTFLDYICVPRSCGELSFESELSGELRRIVARFTFQNATNVRVGEDDVQFTPGDRLNVFTSYRHTPETIRESFERNGFLILEQWITASCEEGVFLAKRI